ncbi:MAG: hypothetical protein MUF59_10095 [Candidatus Krumholzibacteria bacterium]|nr:hypothetical protein [Candidatus Krumholzibacteria bacterium]
MKSRTKLIGMSTVIVILFILLFIYLKGNDRKVSASWDRRSEPRPADGVSAIDRILEQMEFSNIAFNMPDTMNLHETAVIKLILSLKTPIDSLRQMIEADGGVDAARIRVTDRMEARLSGPSFAITAITPEVQALSRNNITESKWEVKPCNKGKQNLHLTLSALMSVDGETTMRAIRTFDKVIEIEVTWNQQTVSFIQKNWQWLWAAILIPVAGWLWKKRKNKARVNE